MFFLGWPKPVGSDGKIHADVLAVVGRYEFNSERTCIKILGSPRGRIIYADSIEPKGNPYEGHDVGLEARQRLEKLYGWAPHWYVGLTEPAAGAVRGLTVSGSSGIAPNLSIGPGR